MISIAALQRSVATWAVILGLVLGACWLGLQMTRGLPDERGTLLGIAFILGTLWAGKRLQAWAAGRRALDEAAVNKVLEAALSMGLQVPEDRAIFPVFYRGHRPPRNLA